MILSIEESIDFLIKHDSKYFKLSYYNISYYYNMVDESLRSTIRYYDDLSLSYNLEDQSILVELFNKEYYSGSYDSYNVLITEFHIYNVPCEIINRIMDYVISYTDKLLEKSYDEYIIKEERKRKVLEMQKFAKEIING